LNSNQVNAKVDEVVGSIKRKAGKMTGSTPLQVKGIAQQTKGKLEGALGRVKNIVVQANQGANRKARKQQDTRPQLGYSQAKAPRTGV
jgi:uncharacterized protein YjbJ (UPF0337 family)